MKPFYLIVLFLNLIAFGRCKDEKCDNPPKALDFKEEDCLKTRSFYVYAASIPCKNCCIMRELIPVGKNVLATLEYTKLGDKPAVNRTIMMYRENNTSSYKIDGKKVPFYLVPGTDCKTKSLLYTAWDKVLYVYTPTAVKEDGFLENLKLPKECNVKLFPYNPKESCK